MRRANATRATPHNSFAFRLDRLPKPADYFQAQGLKLTAGGEWKSAVCPFHKDTNPSLRVRLDTGSFRCMVCGTHGGDVLAFHMQRHGLRFIEAAWELGGIGGPCETPQQAARWLTATAIRDGYKLEALHAYTDTIGNPLHWRGPKTTAWRVEEIRTLIAQLGQ